MHIADKKLVLFNVVQTVKIASFSSCSVMEKTEWYQ